MPSLNQALKPFWRTKADIKILKGGRSSSKTWDTAGFAIYLASTYKLKFLCMRQFQNKIKESVYAVLVIQIDRFGLRSEFEILHNIIKHRKTGSEFHFYGIHRHINEIKGFEGANIGWIEEGEGLTKEQWVIIEPTLRSDGAECWILYNPDLVTNFVESFEHDPDNGVIVRHINYDENPFISDTMLRKINRLKLADYDEYLHIYEGVPRTDDDAVVIKRSWIEASIDAHVKLGIKPTGLSRIGFDISDGGKDKNSQVYCKGIVALWSENWKGGEDELFLSCQRVYAKALELGAIVDYDSIGVGAGAGPKFADMNEERKAQGISGAVHYRKFVAGAAVANPDSYYIDTEDECITNKDFFSNLKAQAWWNVADRFRNTYNAIIRNDKFEEEDLISISSDMPNLSKLVTQLSTPRRKFNKAGKVQVETKEELAKRHIESHNDADAFVMANSPNESGDFESLLKMVLSVKH